METVGQKRTEIVRLLSYNLEKHKAATELSDLIQENDLSILCLQEARTDELPGQLGNLNLFAATDKNRLGLAIYADPLVYELEATLSRGFKKTIHDRIAMPALERLLAVSLSVRATGNRVSVASFHASPLTSSNRHRRMQILGSLESLENFSPHAPVLMAGDYNYPIFKNGLTRVLEEAGYQLDFSDLKTYQKAIFRGHFDFLTSRGCQVDSVRTLPRGRSDHKPVLVEARAA